MAHDPPLPPNLSAPRSMYAHASKRPRGNPSPPIPFSFTQRKATILAHLAVPDEQYTDLSPKGSVDAGIRELIDDINAVEGFVTTSSCAGRVSVFLEGSRGRKTESASDVGGVIGVVALPSHQQVAVSLDDQELVGEHEQTEAAMKEEEEEEKKEEKQLRSNTVAGVGGKGGGGRWLFVSHEPVEAEGRLDSEPNIVAALLGIEEPIFDGREGTGPEDMGGEDVRLIHFKFEPMILHVLTASPRHAQLLLRSGLQAGFRESGAINLIPPPSLKEEESSSATPMVAIRSMGLGLESLIGIETNGAKHCTVSEAYLRALVGIANDRFAENARRIARFRALLAEVVSKDLSEDKESKLNPQGQAWEDAEVRKERKRAEGLRRAEEVRRAKKAGKGLETMDEGMDIGLEGLAGGGQ